MAKELPAVSFLNECFTYDPQSGKLFWKVRPRSHFRRSQGWGRFNSGYAGTEAGYMHFQKSGVPASIRVRLHYLGKVRAYAVHLIALKIMGIELPAGMLVDHHDGDAFNNRWSNLRLATTSQNAANKRNTPGRKYHDMPKGVYPLKGKFIALTRLNGQSHYLGSFATKEEAHVAYCAKATELHGEFARFN